MDHLLRDLPLNIPDSPESFSCSMDANLRKRKRVEDPASQGPSKRPAVAMRGTEWTVQDLEDVHGVLAMHSDKDCNVYSLPIALSHPYKTNEEMAAFLHFATKEVFRLLQLINDTPFFSVLALSAFLSVESGRLSGQLPLESRASSGSHALLVDLDGNELSDGLRDVDFASHMRHYMAKHRSYQSPLVMEPPRQPAAAPPKAAADKSKRKQQRIKVGLYPVNEEVCSFLQSKGLHPLQSIVTPPKKSLAKVIAYVTNKWKAALEPCGISVVLLPHSHTDRRMWTSADTRVTTRDLHQELGGDTLKILYGFDKMISRERDFEFLEKLQELVSQDSGHGQQHGGDEQRSGAACSPSSYGASPYEMASTPASASAASSPYGEFAGGAVAGDAGTASPRDGGAAQPVFSNSFFADAAREVGAPQHLACATALPSARQQQPAAPRVHDGAAGRETRVMWEASCDGFQGHDSRLEVEADEYYQQMDSLGSDQLWAQTNILSVSGSQLTATGELSRSGSLASSASNAGGSRPGDYFGGLFRSFPHTAM